MLIRFDSQVLVYIFARTNTFSTLFAGSFDSMLGKWSNKYKYKAVMQLLKAWSLGWTFPEGAQQGMERLQHLPMEHLHLHLLRLTTLLHLLLLLPTILSQSLAR